MEMALCGMDSHDQDLAPPKQFCAQLDVHTSKSGDRPSSSRYQATKFQVFGSFQSTGKKSSNPSLPSKTNYQNYALIPVRM